MHVTQYLCEMTQIALRMTGDPLHIIKKQAGLLTRRIRHNTKLAIKGQGRVQALAFESTQGQGYPGPVAETVIELILRHMLKMLFEMLMQIPPVSAHMPVNDLITIACRHHIVLLRL